MTPRTARTAIFTVALMIAVMVPSGAASGARPSAPSSTCPVPATDLCTDHVFRGRRWSGPITYYIAPAGMPLGAEQDIQDAFDAWEHERKSPPVEGAYPGDRSNVDFVYGGLTTRGTVRDGVNVVAFIPSGGSASVTVSTKGSRIVEFDMTFNANWNWSSDLTCPTHDCGTVDLQNVTTHEVGHVLDLFHVTAEGNAALTMFPYPQDAAARPGDWRNEISKRDLGAGDLLGLRAAYPA